MNIHEANPNFKTFLFLLLILLCGFISVMIALYLQENLPVINERSQHKMDHRNPSILAASFGSFSGKPDSITEENRHDLCTLSGRIVPIEKVRITVVSDDFVSTTMTDDFGRFRFDRMKPGDYHLSFEAIQPGTVRGYQIDVVSLDEGYSRDLGILELPVY